jgi:4-hydroxyphenylpyruvate dioxygenase
MNEKTFLPIKGIDYVECYVGNAAQSAYFYRMALGFTPTASAGLETGLRDRASICVEQGNMRVVLTTALTSESPVAEYVKRHGDGVKDIAFSVDNASVAFHAAIRHGAQAVMEPTVLEDSTGTLTKATIATFGDTVHSFIQRNDYKGVFLPHYRAITPLAPPLSPGLATLDHFAISVEPGTLDHWFDFYHHAFSFEHLHQEYIETAYSAMNSRAFQDRSTCVKFTMMEPALGKRPSQIEEFLTFNQGPGVQHLGLLTNDIIHAVRTLQLSGIDFMRTPATYYDALSHRVSGIREDITTLRELNILVDRDEWGYLLQIFAKPLHNRPTCFIELIQRHEARSFGSGNIKALFEAVEREQALRGNL